MEENNNGIISRKIIQKTVVTKSGKKFGNVGDLVFDTKSGEIVDLNLVESTNFARELDLEKDSDGSYLIPFHSVIAIGDFVVVSEEEIV